MNAVGFYKPHTSDQKLCRKQGSDSNGKEDLLKKRIPTDYPSRDDQDKFSIKHVNREAARKQIITAHLQGNFFFRPYPGWIHPPCRDRTFFVMFLFMMNLKAKICGDGITNQSGEQDDKDEMDFNCNDVKV